MSDREDRLESMVGDRERRATEGGSGGEDRSPAAPRRRALVYAPPPARARAYLALLEAEGFDAVLATEPEVVETFLSASVPDLLLAVVPTLAPELRDRWRRRAPEAELRVVPRLTDLVTEAIVPAPRLIDFSVAALAALVGVLSASRGVPQERVTRTLSLAVGAAAELGLGPWDTAAVRMAAVLREVPDLLAAEHDGEGVLGATERGDPGAGRRLVAEFAAALGCPFPLGPAGGEEPGASEPPSPEQVAEAAHRMVLLLEGEEAQPALALRRVARGPEGGGLHPAAVEAVLAAWHQDRREERAKILLVDSSVASRNLLALRLRNEGYRTSGVSDGRSALEEIRRDPPDLILAETVLPRLDGFGLLDALHQGGLPQIPFVFVSSRSDPVSINKGLLLGAADFLAKPVNLEVLLTKIEKILAQATDLSDLPARLSLSEVSQATGGRHPLVSYGDLAAGKVILGRFQIEADLGEGGMGRVFKARDLRLEEPVVLKVMKPSLSGDAAVLRRFQREIRLARRITHPGVVRIFDFWEAGALKFVTMEFLEGSDLRNEIRRRGSFPVPVALRIAAELFEALDAAHSVGVLHRDIKPHNVLMLPSGRIKVVDFGIAQGLEVGAGEGGTWTGSLVGTPEYASPEQILGEDLDARSDLYSAGVLLFELLTGEVPFRAKSRGASARLRLSQPPPAVSARQPGVPEAVDALLARLLAREREERYPSAEAVLAALRGLQA